MISPCVTINGKEPVTENSRMIFNTVAKYRQSKKTARQN